jgi:hypothetical protein
MTANLKLNIPILIVTMILQRIANSMGVYIFGRQPVRDASYREGMATSHWKWMATSAGFMEVWQATEWNQKNEYQALLYNGNSRFNAVLEVDSPDGEYKRLEAHGFYWR